jgi:hypothetical protein
LVYTSAVHNLFGNGSCDNITIERIKYVCILILWYMLRQKYIKNTKKMLTLKKIGYLEYS